MGVSSDIEIGGIRAKKGQVARGFLAIGETVTGPIQIPIVIINGEMEGTVLCLTAGVHATEYAPIEALLRLTNELRPEALRGSIIAVPVVNMHMFASRCGFVSPIDGLNLNKIAPGGDGSISEVIARVLLDEVIAKANYYIDLHAGDIGEMLLAFSGYSLTGDSELDREGEALVRLFTPRLISLARDGGTVPPFPGSLVHAATRKGIVAILTESGGNATLEEADVRVHVDGIRNIMRYLKMIDGEPVISEAQITATGRSVTRAKRSGLLRLKVGIGDLVEDGQEVAEICDVFGQVIERVHVTRGGLAGLVWAHKAVNSGDPIVRCWYTESVPPFPATDRFVRLQDEGKDCPGRTS
jgi:predicted deacylase